MSNLCSEILQVQTPSLINDAQEFVKMGTDISCNLGSTNILNMMTSPDFGRSIRAMTRALTFVTDSSNIEAVQLLKMVTVKHIPLALGLWGFIPIWLSTISNMAAQNLSNLLIFTLC